MSSTPEQRRILVIDDNPAIHADFAKILCPQIETNAGLQDAKAAFFGKAKAKPADQPYRIDAAPQGKDALALVERALAEKSPYALAFVDVRMPPGWDGVETISHLWKADPDLQCVICTAYADYSWDEMIAKLGRNDRLLILKKPFDPIEVCQIASAMTEKWAGSRRERERLEEVKRAEQEARAYASSLVTTNRALEASRARAEAALQTKSECLASLSQEIRTPLLAILGYAELLRDVHSEGALRSEHAAMIHGHGEALLTTLSDLFDLSCIETQRLVITRSSFSPQALVDEVLGGVAAQARAQSLELGSEWLTPAPQTIESDPARLRQVLHHLVENAVKFTAHGSVRVRLSLESRPAEEALLRIAVADTGEGLPPELHGRLFEAFTTQVGQHVRERGGAGLGLALSKRLAQLLGGDLSVESTPGSGSTFTLTVKAGTPGPIVEALQPRAPIPAPAPVEDPDLPVLAGARILIIEDVAATQKLLRHFLEAAGAEVEAAGDGRSGVDLALAAGQRGQGFDLVLMDVQLPILDGNSAAKELRQRGFTRPIVALTASAMSGDREACLAAGCDDHASKPLGRRALIELCRGWTRAGEQHPVRRQA